MGASINFMPLVVYNKLELRPPKLNLIGLLMEDHLVKKSMEILCDVLVKVGSFIFPTNFVVLAYEVDFEVFIILERPFLMAKWPLVDMETMLIKF